MKIVCYISLLNYAQNVRNQYSRFIHDILMTQLHADSKQSYSPSIEIKQTIIAN